MERRGYGAAKGAKQGEPTPRICISPQLAPPVLTPRAKKMFAATEDYHKPDRGTGGKR